MRESKEKLKDTMDKMTDQIGTLTFLEELTDALPEEELRKAMKVVDKMYDTQNFKHGSEESTMTRMGRAELMGLVEIMAEQIGYKTLYQEMAKAQNTDELRTNVEYIVAVNDMPQLPTIEEADAFEERDILMDTLDYFADREGLEYALDNLAQAQDSDELFSNLEHIDQMYDLGNL